MQKKMRVFCQYLRRRLMDMVFSPGRTSGWEVNVSLSVIRHLDFWFSRQGHVIFAIIFLQLKPFSVLFLKRGGVECSWLQSATPPRLGVYSYVQTSTINQLRHRALPGYRSSPSFSTKQHHATRYSQPSLAEHRAASMLSRGCVWPIPLIFTVSTYQLGWAWKVLKRKLSHGKMLSSPIEKFKCSSERASDFCKKGSRDGWS